jgi:chromosome segregation ATPase
MNERAGETVSKKKGDDSASKDPGQAVANETKPSAAAQPVDQRTPDQEPPVVAPVPAADKCPDPEKLLKELKTQLENDLKCLRASQEEFLDRQQRVGGLEASIKQLEKLGSGIDEAIKKYKASYDTYVEQKRTTECYYTTKYRTAESALADGVADAIGEIVNEADAAIDALEEDIEEATDHFADSAAKQETAKHDLEEHEADFAAALAVDKRIASLLKSLKDWETKIEAAEDACDFCAMYYYVSEYEDVWNDLCEAVKSPDGLRSELNEAWCDLKSSKQALSDATVERDKAKRTLEQLEADLKSLIDGRERHILDEIASIPDCHDGETEPSESELVGAT